MNLSFRACHKENKIMYRVKGFNFEMGMITVEDCDDSFWLDDAVIMQSTNLFDDNGVEIFEGDILEKNRNQELTNEWRQVYDSGNPTGVVKMAEGRWVIDDGEELIDLFHESTKNKVIGNVYENSELVG
ncbi:YopX family protein [Streptococcus phocae subsp. phocae]